MFPYSQTPLLGTLSQSLQNKDLLPIKAFSLHFRKMCVLKDQSQIIQMSLQGTQHFSSGSDLVHQWPSEKEANGRERTWPHSPRFCHLSWNRIVAFSLLHQLVVCSAYLEILLYRRECLSLVLLKHWFKIGLRNFSVNSALQYLITGVLKYAGFKTKRFTDVA